MGSAGGSSRRRSTASGSSRARGDAERARRWRVALPPWLARFNRHATNRLTSVFAGRAPGFGIVIHTGRRSGRVYRTPVNAFRDGDDDLIALTYGAQADWVRNVLAAGGCTLVTRGRAVRLTNS